MIAILESVSVPIVVIAMVAFPIIFMIGAYILFRKINQINQETLKICPFCAERIQRAAIVCRHCQRDIPNSFG